MEMKNIPKVFADAGALSSVVEHYLHTVGVAGSKPAARTIPRLLNLSTHVAAEHRPYWREASRHPVEDHIDGDCLFGSVRFSYRNDSPIGFPGFVLRGCPRVRGRG